MADLNILANDVLVEQAPAITPLIKTDDQILPVNKWVPIGKSNYILDVLKSQRNPIFPIAVALLKNTNFFRAFTASSMIPAIYLQQFWDTISTKVTKPKAAKVIKPAGDQAHKKRKLVKETSDDPMPAKRSKDGVGKRHKAKSPLKLIDEPNDEGVPVEEPAHDDEEADLQRALELSLKEQGERTQVQACPVVLREPDSEKLRPLLEVQGKGKEKVVEEQAAHDLLTI
ncbi:integrase, catalytic region, zinc finger, CCHC-type containing protein [Tanacetum coccineum]